jgi:Protein of unknown function (DUF551)
MMSNKIESAWQPIETMPRTGEVVLLWSKKWGYSIGNCPPGHMVGFWRKRGNNWYGAAGMKATEATHWKSLPQEPISAEPKE